jgi:GGDEF domain-containing protein
MIAAPPHPEELRRLKSLERVHLLDTPADPYLDTLVELGKRVFAVQTVLISLVDQDRQWFKSRVGLDVCETSRDASFCAYAILESEPLIVSDTGADTRFASNPLVVGPPGIRFYAGHPIYHAGLPIGTFCLIDSKPRELGADGRVTLRDFAKLAEGYIQITARSRSIKMAQKALVGGDRRGLLDPVLQIWNRAGIERLYESLRSRGPTRSQLGLVYLATADIDRSPSIPDAELRDAIKRLRGAIRDGDVLGRVGPASFAVLARTRAASELGELAARLWKAVEPALPKTPEHKAGGVGASLVTDTDTFEAALNLAQRQFIPAKW